MSIAIAAACCVLLVLGAMSLWVRRRQRRRDPFTTRSAGIVSPAKMAAMPDAGDVLVYVNEDGSVRELTGAEKTYVSTQFSPLDGARPYIKSRYLDRTTWGIRGYLPRAEVPRGVAIAPAPQQGAPQPQTPQAVAESLSQLVHKHGRS